MFDIKVPFPLMADAYTISSNDFASEACRTESVYSIVNRKSPISAWPDVAHDSRMCMYGVSHFIRSHLMQPVTKDDVYESQLFMNRACSFGGGLPFPLELWNSVVHDFNGYIPVEIRALPEASTFFPNVPYVQVKSLAPGFGELAAHIEAVMLGMVSLATARLTYERHWLNELKGWVAKDLPADDDEVLYKTAQWLIHEFSMRACSVAEQSQLLGLCHLLCFHGTDTFNAAYTAWKLGCKPMTGTSILAGAHRNVQGYENDVTDGEVDYIEAMHKSTEKCNGKMGSYIADCYNYQNFISKKLVVAADKYKQSVFVGRPDSGNALDNVLYVIHQGKQNMRYIEGNSVKPQPMFKILQGILDAGYKCTQHGIFGVGGELVNNISRDHLSSKYALTNANGRPEVKLSEDSGKLTVPGPNVVSSESGAMKVFLEKEISLAKNELKVYYTANESGPSYTFMNFEKFSVQQDRCIDDFDKWATFASSQPSYGLKGEPWSDQIKSVQQHIVEKYRTCLR